VKTPCPGKLVMVNGHQMHVFSEGQGKEAFVFLSGGGTRWPTEDFKPLWSLLSDRYRIVVVEKSGYGWSEAAQTPRDLDIILEESREALRLCEISAPYILVPHSMSGLEALYWAQKYPNEVRAIIGLDPAIPEAYEILKIPPMFLIRLLCILGLASSDMVNEVSSVKANAKMVKNLPTPIDTPVYFFISNGKRLLGIKNWEELLTNFLSGFTSQKHLSLKCGHYVHRYEPAKIADEINAFVENI
jgi:pimeloyl-ACP methyl ester carboxylesterase